MNRSQHFEMRFLDFGGSVCRLTSKLPKTDRGYYIADQLFRSGTSIGAHMREARSAESKADLIHKMQLALKEAREAHYWLSLTEKGDLLQDAELPKLIQEAFEITAILARSVITAKQNLKAKK